MHSLQALSSTYLIDK